MPGDTDISDAAVRKATGHGWDHWMELMDGFGDVSHKQRAKAVYEAGGISGWWSQMVTVEYERRRGIREVGQASTGGFQVSCSKTVAWDPDACFERVVASGFLPNADWSEGATWETDGGRVEVRKVVPGKQLRWFWFDDEGKSTVVVDFWPNKSGDKHSIRFGHEGLASAEARERYRKKWKKALMAITAG